MWEDAVAASFGHWQFIWLTGENLTQGRWTGHDSNKISTEYKAEEIQIRQHDRWFPVLLWRHNYNGRWSSSDTRHQKRHRYDYVWWWHCKYLRHVEDDNRLWRLLSYGTWHHQLVKIYQTKRSFISDEGILESRHRENVKSCNNDYFVVFSNSSSISPSHSDFFRFFQPIPSTFFQYFAYVY